MIGILRLAIVLIVFGTNVAIAGDIFAVNGVRVDATANTSAEARQNALVAGHERALETVFKRLTPASYWDQLPAPQTLDLDSILSGFRISDEKTSPRRYRAALSVSFKPERIRELVYDREIPLSEVQAQPVLLLPIMEDREGLVLWQENWWRSLWQEQDLTNSLVPLILPLGDISDTLEASAEDILGGDRLRIDLLKTRYGTSSVYVVHALADVDGQLGVTLYSYENGNVAIEVLSFLGADREDLGRRAIAELQANMAENWKQATAILSRRETSLMAEASYESFEEWRGISAQLNETRLIRNVTLTELSTRSAFLKLEFVGSIDQLQSNLEQVGLRLVPGFNNYSLVSIR